MIGSVFDGFDLVTRLLVRLAEIVVTVIIFFITIVMILAVFFRFALNSSIGWSDEITSLLLATMMFLVIGVGMHERFHIGLSALFDRITISARRWLDVILHLVALAFFVLIAQEGIRMAMISMDMRLATLPLPRGLFQLSAPIGASFAALVCVNNIVKVVRGIDTPHGPQGD